MSGIRYVCVDNEIIRRNLRKDKNLRIQMVPCVLVVYNTKQASKHEGTDCFRWFNNILKTVRVDEEEVEEVEEESEIPDFMRDTREQRGSRKPPPPPTDDYDYESEFGDTQSRYHEGDFPSEEEIIGTGGGMGRPTGVNRGGNSAVSIASQMASEREAMLENEDPSKKYSF